MFITIYSIQPSDSYMSSVYVHVCYISFVVLHDFFFFFFVCKRDQFWFAIKINETSTNPNLNCVGFLNCLSVNSSLANAFYLVGFFIVSIQIKSIIYLYVYALSSIIWTNCALIQFCVLLAYCSIENFRSAQVCH